VDRPRVDRPSADRPSVDRPSVDLCDGVNPRGRHTARRAGPGRQDDSAGHADRAPRLTAPRQAAPGCAWPRWAAQFWAAQCWAGPVSA